MDRGWGLAVESESSIENLESVFFRKQFGETSLSRMQLVPVNLNPRDAADDAAGDQHRRPVNEVDFFSDHRRKDLFSRSAEKKDLESSSEVKPDLNLNTRLHLLTTNTGSDQSTMDDGVSSDAEDKKSKTELAMLQAELERMNAENQRLKGMLAQVSQNYNALQMHVVSIMQHQNQLQQEKQNQNLQAIPSRLDQHEAKTEPSDNNKPRQFLELVSRADNQEPSDETSLEERTADDRLRKRDETPESESQRWVANKAQKLSPELNPGAQAENQQASASTEATMRKARVSVRARSEAPMISDGCQWRKYGQKMAKGNPCPRAYYRCTMAVGCPVRKQVQRCAEDRSILITTYEGTHNHPLPPAAMAMASTTSAAATMLLSGSMPSSDGASLMNPSFLARTILPCSSNMATISASAPFPTVTLDLTHSGAATSSNLNNPLQQFHRAPPLPTAHFPLALAHGLPGPAQSQQLSQILLGQALYNQSKFSGLHSSSSSQGQTMDANTLSAATAAIASDPKFTAALAAAISSIISGGQGSNNNNSASNGNGNGNSANGNSSSMQQ